MTRTFYIATQLTDAISDGSLRDRLDVLQQRHCISAPEADRPITRILFTALCDQSQEAALYACLDQQDSQNVINAFSRNLHLMPVESCYLSSLWFIHAVWSGPNPSIHASTLIVIIGDLLASTIKTHGYRGGHRWHIQQLGATVLQSAG
jgi:hypothetical protein